MLNESGIAIPAARQKSILPEVMQRTIKLEQSCVFGAGEQKKAYNPAMAGSTSLSVWGHAQAGLMLK